MDVQGKLLFTQKAKGRGSLARDWLELFVCNHAANYRAPYLRCPEDRLRSRAAAARHRCKRLYLLGIWRLKLCVPRLPATGEALLRGAEAERGFAVLRTTALKTARILAPSNPDRRPLHRELCEAAHRQPLASRRPGRVLDQFVDEHRQVVFGRNLAGPGSAGAGEAGRRSQIGAVFFFHAGRVGRAAHGSGERIHKRFHGRRGAGCAFASTAASADVAACGGRC